MKKLISFAAAGLMAASILAEDSKDEVINAAKHSARPRNSWKTTVEVVAGASSPARRMARPMKDGFTTLTSPGR